MRTVLFSFQEYKYKAIDAKKATKNAARPIKAAIDRPVPVNMSEKIQAVFGLMRPDGNTR
jgi:hypothetical protein